MSEPAYRVRERSRSSSPWRRRLAPWSARRGGAWVGSRRDRTCGRRCARSGGDRRRSGDVAVPLPVVGRGEAWVLQADRRGAADPFRRRVRSVAAGLTASSDAGRWGLWLSAAVAASMLVWLVLLYARADGAARIVGFLTVALCVGMLVALAGTAEGSTGVAALQLLAGAAFLGSTLDGLL